KQSLGEIVRRHEVFRTAFFKQKGKPTAIVSGPVDVSLPVTALNHLSAEEREREVLRLAEAEARQPFDLSKGRLLRAKLLRLDDHDHVFLMTTHHIVCDG